MAKRLAGIIHDQREKRRTVGSTGEPYDIVQGSGLKITGPVATLNFERAIDRCHNGIIHLELC
jgi:hypothetical protein